MNFLSTIPWITVTLIVLAVIVLALCACIYVLYNRIYDLQDMLHDEIEKRRAVRQAVLDLRKQLNLSAEPKQPKVESKVQIKEEPKSVSETIVGEQAPTTIQPQIFVKHHNHGIMRECDQTTAQYRLLELKDNTAKFEFCGNIEKAVKNSDTVFDYVADIQGETNNATTITTAECGKVQHLEDGQWKVIKKAILKFK